MNVVAIVAHPDDEILGFGGVLAKHVDSGDVVSVVILGEGLTSRDKTIDKALIEKLQSDARLANEKIGVSAVYFDDLPDNEFDTIPMLAIAKKVEQYIADLSPHTIYTHHYGDLNIDHRKCAEAVQTAARPCHSCVKQIIAGEILSSTEWNVQDETTVFCPNRYVDIADSFDKKVAALLCYKSEVCTYPHPRSEEGVRILAEKRGLEVGLRYAEAFSIVREIM